MLFLSEKLAQLLFLVLLLKPLFHGLSKKLLRSSGLELSLSCDLDKSGSLKGLSLFAAMVSVPPVPMDEASVGD